MIRTDVKADPSLRELVRDYRRQERQAFRRVGQEALAEVRLHAPGGRIGRAFRSRVKGRKIWISPRGRMTGPAVALERGAIIVPVDAKALRFRRGGRTVFTRGPVRIRARHYMDRARLRMPEIAQRTLDRELDLG